MSGITWEDITANVIEFNTNFCKGQSIASQRFAQFSHWYYVPELDMFGPSKFIGYPDTTHENYAGLGDGGETQRYLSHHFTSIPYTSPDYQYYLEKLEAFAQSHEQKISQKTKTCKHGGLYLPKGYIDGIEESQADVVAMEAEWEYGTSAEGNLEKRLTNRYERDSRLRANALRIHGHVCCVCGFDFEKTYGPHGKEFIEVHHTVPLSKVKESHSVDPKKDMVVLCANCHRMIHRNQADPLTVDELKNLLKKNSK